MNDGQQNTENREQVGIADCFVISMFSPKEYEKLLGLKTGKIAVYVLLLTLLISIIQYAIPVMSAVAAMGGMKKLIINEVPDFSIKEGKFSLSEKFEKSDEQAGVYMILDTTVKEYEKEDVPVNAVQAVMVSESNILVYNSMVGLGGTVEEIHFSDYKDVVVDNEILADMSGFIYAGMFSTFVLIWFFMIIKHLFVALFYAAALFILVQTMMVDATFGRVYKTALFAQSVGAIVLAITYCVNNSLFIMAGGIFNIFVTVSIMNRALVHIAKEGG